MRSGTYRDASTDCDGVKFNSICVSYPSFHLIHSYSIPFNIKSATFTVYFTHLREFFPFSEVTLSILVLYLLILITYSSWCSLTMLQWVYGISQILDLVDKLGSQVIRY